MILNAYFQGARTWSRTSMRTSAWYALQARTLRSIQNLLCSTAKAPQAWTDQRKELLQSMAHFSSKLIRISARMQRVQVYANGLTLRMAKAISKDAASFRSVAYDFNYL